MNMQTINSFRLWWDLGYRELLPIIPPGAELDEKFLNRIKQLGKMPGVKYRNGKWGPIKGWHNLQATEADIETWNLMGASVGLRTGVVFLLDIDAYDEKTAQLIEDTLIRLLGPAPMRVGSWPKRALLYASEKRMSIPKLSFTGFESGPGQIEVPPQVVVGGVHATTLKPYSWPRPPVPVSELTVVTREQVAAAFETLKGLLPAASSSDYSDDGEARSPVELAGPKQIVLDLMAGTPNKSKSIDYHDWIKFAIALHGALPNDLDDALEAFIEFSERSDIKEITEDPVRTFHSVPTSRKLGYDWLINRAHVEVGIRFDADIWAKLPDISLPTTPTQISEDVYLVLTMEQIRTMEPPRFLIDRHLPENSVGILYGSPGSGKSFLALDVGLHIAYGEATWHGDPIAAQNGMVLYIAGEGASGMQSRIDAWKERHNHTLDSPRFSLLPVAVNFLNDESGKKLMRTLRKLVASYAMPMTMIVVDTVSRSIPGADENTQKEMTLFVNACAAIQQEFKCAVMGIHHPNKQGDLRGSTVLAGACDYVLKLERKKGHSVGFLHCEKQKDAIDGWKDTYRFDLVGDAKKGSLVPTRLNIVDADTMPQALEDAVLGALERAWDAGLPWSKVHHGKERWAVRIMTKDYGMDAHDAQLKLDEWLNAGLVVEDVRSKKDKKKGLRRAKWTDEDAADGADLTAKPGAFE